MYIYSIAWKAGFSPLALRSDFPSTTCSERSSEASRKGLTAFRYCMFYANAQQIGSPETTQRPQTRRGWLAVQTQGDATRTPRAGTHRTHTALTLL